jgi:type III pantothenate kinase
MILVFDIGNTHTVFGAFDRSGKLHHSFRLRTDRKATGDEIYLYVHACLERAGISLAKIEQMVMGSVVPEVEREWRKAVEPFPNLKTYFTADHRSPWSFRIALKNAAQVGSDRLANAEAALSFGVPAIVVDAGTATTFDVLDKGASGPEYVGGAILPGPGISFDALIQRTSRLPSISMMVREGNLPVVGSDTEEALQSGLVHGFAAMVDGMVERICNERKFPSGIPVIATGGFASLLQKTSLRVTHFAPDLTLEGFYALIRKI